VKGIVKRKFASGCKRNEIHPALDLFVQEMEEIQNLTAEIDGDSRAIEVQNHIFQHQAVYKSWEPIDMIRMGMSHEESVDISRLIAQLFYLLSGCAGNID
jgi:hypothetical protein